MKVLLPTSSHSNSWSWATQEPKCLLCELTEGGYTWGEMMTLLRYGLASRAVKKGAGSLRALPDTDPPVAKPSPKLEPI